MKTPLIHHLAASGIACLFVLAATPSARASDDDLVANSLSAAQSWITQIDSGQYQDSYDSGGSALHEKTKEDVWLRVLRALRQPWGDVLNRKEVNHEFKPDGFEGAEGQFMVVTYDTSFKKLPDAMEVVVLKLEDGKWRGAGYNLGPKPPPANSVSPEPPTTEVESGNVPLTH